MWWVYLQLLENYQKGYWTIRFRGQVVHRLDRLLSQPLSLRLESPHEVEQRSVAKAKEGALDRGDGLRK